eukprot:5127777-Pyramimonas_sp.AAC.2
MSSTSEGGRGEQGKLNGFDARGPWASGAKGRTMGALLGGEKPNGDRRNNRPAARHGAARGSILRTCRADQRAAADPAQKNFSCVARTLGHSYPWDLSLIHISEPTRPEPI